MSEETARDPVQQVDTQEQQQSGAGSSSAEGVPQHASGAGDETDELRDAVIEVIQTIYDPEIPVNIYDLGLIYDVAVDDAKFVNVRMTLTSPGCPVAVTLPPEVEQKITSVPGVAGAKVEVVWDPPWNQSMMTDAARLQLNLF